MKRVGLYVRVSSAEQKNHGLSVDNQIDSLTKYAQENGYEIHSIYNDAGFSARKSYKKRPDLLRMLEDCQDKKLDLVLFTRLDRFFRSVPDYYACVERMNGVPWRAIWEDYETETSSGVFKVNIMLSIAQSEADRTSEKVKSVFAYKREQGGYVGKAPWGYKTENGRLIKDESCADQVRRTFDIYLRTLNMNQTCRITYDLGFYVKRRRLCHMLNCETYRGIAQNSTCEPYITPEEAMIIDETKGRKHRKPVQYGRFYSYSGLIECPLCGGILHSATKITPATSTTKEYVKRAYLCHGVSKKPHRYFQLAQSVADNLILDALDAELNRYNSEIILSNKGIDVDSTKKKLEAKLNRLKVLFEEGDINLEDYKRKRDEIKNEIFKLPTEKKRELIELPHDWRQQYDLLDDEHKQMFVRRIIKRVYINEDKTLRSIDFL